MSLSVSPGERVSAEFFSLLNIKPILGRTFRNQEDKLGAAPVAVIGDYLWKRKFNSSPSVLGTALNLGGEIYTVVGVIPARLVISSIRSRSTYSCPSIALTIRFSEIARFAMEPQRRRV